MQSLNRNYVENFRMRSVTLGTIAFPDDLVLEASSEEKLQYNLDVWNEELSRWDPQVSQRP